MTIVLSVNLFLFFYCFVVVEKPATFVPESNETCQICEVVMTYLKNLLADNATKVHVP